MSKKEREEFRNQHQGEKSATSHDGTDLSDLLSIPEHRRRPLIGALVILVLIVFAIILLPKKSTATFTDTANESEMPTRLNTDAYYNHSNCLKSQLQRQYNMAGEGRLTERGKIQLETLLRRVDNLDARIAEHKGSGLSDLIAKVQALDREINDLFRHYSWSGQACQTPNLIHPHVQN